jgi:subtilase family serine protease
MVLVLQRSREQELALQQFNERQYDSQSPDFHHWLHAEEFGRLYGPSDDDIATVTSWLQNHGFSIYKVSKGRVTIEFSGTVAQVESAFHVEMHHYLVNDVEHLANDRDPAIPEALSPVILGIASLHDFYDRPQVVLGDYVKRDPHTGKITIVAPPSSSDQNPHSIGIPQKSGATPLLTYTDGVGDIHEDLTPYDFATIYNILPLWTASTPINGKGVKIAISGVSDIASSDVSTFRKSFGLPTLTWTAVHNGKDPGADGGGGQGENTLDVEMAGATAPGATVTLVVSASTSTTGGDQLSDAYIIDNEVAPIMSASYGECELGLGTAGNAAINKIWQQGATEGISIFESAGDQGSAGCSNSDKAGPNADVIGLQVNGIASSPYLTAVGGTDFTWSLIDKPISTYWNSSNNAELATAKGYLPEVPWNSTCANPLLLNLFTSVSNTEELCNAALASADFQGLVKITGGSGGVSHCTTPSGTTNASCSGGYAKPSWQVGTGVPADGKRDLPDVSLFASGGFPSGVNGSAILFCDSTSGSGGCNYTNPNEIIYQEVGGTSASSPLMAGVMALILQKVGASQGLANPVLYALFQKQISAGTSCNSSTAANGNSCVFYDISQGTNSQVCVTGDPNCVTNTSGDELGLLSGYAATTGYDRAIGLGSVNVKNLVNAWPLPATLTLSVSPSGLTYSSTKVGSTSAAQTVTIKNTGTGSVTLSSVSLTGTDPSSFLKSATTCGSTLAASASCTVSVEFKPAVTGALTAALSITDNAAGSPQKVTLSGTGIAASTLIVSPSSLSFGSVDVGTTTTAQKVTLTNTGTSTVTLKSISLTGTNSSSFLDLNACGTTIAASAMCTVLVAFDPATTGSLVATLSVSSSASTNAQSVALSGAGTAQDTVTISPTALTFATTAHGTTSPVQSISLKNSGTTTVNLYDIVLAGANPSDFEELNTCGSTLSAGGSCTVYVSFKPAAVASYSATITIYDNAKSSPQTISLTGKGE